MRRCSSSRRVARGGVAAGSRGSKGSVSKAVVSKEQEVALQLGHHNNNNNRGMRMTRQQSRCLCLSYCLLGW
jgi:hypothetical protein